MPFYTDIDISLKKHPGTKDVLKKTDVNSVRAALRNIFMTNPGEKPFNFEFGLGLYHYLFENYSPGFSLMMKRKCIEQIALYEPRVVIDGIDIRMGVDSNELEITLQFHIVADPAPQTLNITLERTR